MKKLSIYYLFITMLFLGCNDSPTSNNNSTTTGGSSLNLISLEFGNYTNTSVDIIINTSENISGFQFTIIGPTIAGYSGGLANQYGFSIANNPDTGIIIGYSLSGNVIPSGSNDILTTLTFDDNHSQICFENVILSDPNALALNIDFIGDCIEY